jgi:hypothetical protein
MICKYYFSLFHSMMRGHIYKIKPSLCLRIIVIDQILNMASRNVREQGVKTEINRGQALAEDSASIGRGILGTLADQQGM